jgi:hypothetical protein
LVVAAAGKWLDLRLVYTGADCLPIDPAGKLPRLAWCSLGSNPAAAGVPALPELPRVRVADIQLGTKLGQGASGEVFNGEASQVQVFAWLHMYRQLLSILLLQETAAKETAAGVGLAYRVAAFVCRLRHRALVCGS